MWHFYNKSLKLPCCLAVLCFRVQTSCSAPSAVTALQEMLSVNWNNSGDRFALPFIASSVKKNLKPKYFGWCRNICKSNYIPISFRRLGLEVGFHLVTSWKLWSWSTRSYPAVKTTFWSPARLSLRSQKWSRDIGKDATKTSTQESRSGDFFLMCSFSASAELTNWNTQWRCRTQHVSPAYPQHAFKKRTEGWIAYPSVGWRHPQKVTLRARVNSRSSGASVWRCEGSKVRSHVSSSRDNKLVVSSSIMRSI